MDNVIALAEVEPHLIATGKSNGVHCMPRFQMLNCQYGHVISQQLPASCQSGFLGIVLSSLHLLWLFLPF